MRKKINIYIAFVIVLFITSCDYLDYNPTSGQNKEESYAYFDNITRLVSSVYSFLPVDFGSVSNAMVESATDNSVYTWENNRIYYFINGTWGPLKTVDTGWTYWQGIRAANSFLENFDIAVIERFQYNDNYDEMIGKAKLFTTEVRFLRAFYYFELAKRYGDIPLLTRVYNQDEINSVKKTSFQEVINFIVQECSEIAPLLPVNHANFWGDTGRATSGAALALKSRALLYAASPLHNPDGDKQKWESAAKAAYEVISMNVYSLPKITSDPLYSNAGGNDVLGSKQLIFERRSDSKTNSFEGVNLPMGYEGAQGGNTPTQNLVDAFEMKDGSTFDWSNPSHLKNMYIDDSGNPTRDPRLYLNVLTNGSLWMNQSVETFQSGKNKAPEGSTKTGYYLRKYMNQTVSLDPFRPNLMEHHYILFRYAEILLNYAEAMYEWVGADEKTDDCPLSSREALNMVRESADMKYIELNGQDYLDKLRNERRIELAFEGHRFFDIRRWKIADDEDVRNIYGIKILKNGDNDYSYEKILLYTIKWSDKMYLFPFPQNEKYLTGLDQNPGW